MFDKIIIKDELENVTQPILGPQATKEQHFAACIVLFLDSVSGGHLLSRIMPGVLEHPTSLAPGQFAPATTLIMFISNFHSHPEFSTERVFADDHPYKPLACQFAHLLQCPMGDANEIASVNQAVVDILRVFVAPRIGKIQIDSIESKNQQVLNKCGFPLSLVPEFVCNITQQLFDMPCYISNHTTPIEKSALKKHLFEYHKDPLTNKEASESDIKDLLDLAEHITLFVNKVDMMHTALGHEDSVKRYNPFLSHLKDSNISLDKMHLILKADQAEFLYSDALSLFKSKKYQQALSTFEMALDGFHYDKKPVEKAACLYNIASCYDHLDNIDKAIQHTEL